MWRENIEERNKKIKTWTKKGKEHENSLSLSLTLSLLSPLSSQRDRRNRANFECSPSPSPSPYPSPTLQLLLCIHFSHLCLSVSRTLSFSHSLHCFLSRIPRLTLIHLSSLNLLPCLLGALNQTYRKIKNAEREREKDREHSRENRRQNPIITTNA